MVKIETVFMSTIPVGINHKAIIKENERLVQTGEYFNSSIVMSELSDFVNSLCGKFEEVAINFFPGSSMADPHVTVRSSSKKEMLNFTQKVIDYLTANDFLYSA